MAVYHKPTLRAKVPQWMAEKTEELAGVQDISVSEVIRQALAAHLDKYDRPAPGLNTPTE